MASSHTREGLLALITQTLSGEGIPAVLWGNFLLTVHGVPSIVSVSLLSSTCVFLNDNPQG